MLLGRTWYTEGRMGQTVAESRGKWLAIHTTRGSYIGEEHDSEKFRSKGH